MFSFFNKKPASLSGLKVDIHSHLISGIDDGSKSMEESVELLKKFKNLGYEKVITTPHIIKDFYPNTKELIYSKLEDLRERVIQEKIDIQVEAAAEHYLDEHLLSDVESDNILTFGGKYFLFETPFINEPANIKELVFAIKSKGLIPVLAHPERYAYLQMKNDMIDDLFERGVLFQINTVSLTGYYSFDAKKLAEKLIQKKMVHFAGSDCHTMRHLLALEKAQSTKHYKKLMDLPLLNDSLL